MRPIDHPYRVLYSELAERTLDASFSSEFSLNGRFVAVESRGRRYWYYDSPDGQGGKARRYVGPVDDAEITDRVDRFKTLKENVRVRRKLVSTLVREAYLPRPDRVAGDVVAALATAGFFRLRGVLVGSLAFQTYPAMLGLRLPHASMQTGDADFAQFHSISVAVGDEMLPVLEVLRSVDETFREIPHSFDGRVSTQFISRTGYRVDFLTPNQGSADREGHPALMPALPGAAAEPLRFLDFLIYEPVRVTLLHGAGVPVLVPSPARFATHKLIVATRRRTDHDGTAKSGKDRDQALILMDAMIALRNEADLAEAYMEAWDRGPSWRQAIGRSMEAIGKTAASRIKAGLANGVVQLREDPATYDL